MKILHIPTIHNLDCILLHTQSMHPHKHSTIRTRHEFLLKSIKRIKIGIHFRPKHQVFEAHFDTGREGGHFDRGVIAVIGGRVSWFAGANAVAGALRGGVLCTLGGGGGGRHYIVVRMLFSHVK